MSLRNSGVNNWRELMAQGLPQRFKSVFRANARQGLLKQVNTHLLVFDDKLVNLRNGSWRTLDGMVGQNAERIAEAAVELLQPLNPEQGILLLLPAQEFLASTVSMPGVNRESVRSALKLQSHVLLPGCDIPLMLAVNPQDSDAERPDTALWISEQRVNDLFAAFTAKDLFLVAIQPRVLAAAAAIDNVVIDDSDNQSITHLHLRQGAMLHWYRLSRLDLEVESFREQWDALTQASLADQPDRLSLKSSDDYLALVDKIVADRDYSFIPKGAEAHRKKLQKGKRMGVIAAAAAVVVFLGFVPFIVQSIQMAYLRSSLERQQEQTASARSDQSIVREFEQQWGAFIEFPRQDLNGTLLALQEVINPGVLTSFELDEGFISLEGDSSDPQSLLEQLERNERFTEVDFARATSNTRYYIDLRLSTVDFPSYRQWYFPNVR